MRPGAVRLTVLGVIVVTAIAAQAAGQALYRWVDEDGVVHYSQFPPPAPSTRGDAPIAARGETAVTARRKGVAATRDKARARSRGEAVASTRDETLAGSRGEALRTARGEAVARGDAQSRARARDPRAGARGCGRRSH